MWTFPHVDPSGWVEIIENNGFKLPWTQTMAGNAFYLVLSTQMLTHNRNKTILPHTVSDML